MGFKADTSFLRFLSMGAAGVDRTMIRMSERGFAPIELERYCGSNKIWATKVKRLRLPDLLCVKTGLRVEVRAKSDLKIRMSDALNNPDRAWDAGLRDDDVVAFIACRDADEGPVPAQEPVFFTVASLRESIAESRLGPPKSASEGAERDRTWPATVPSRDGVVRLVIGDKLVVEMGGDGLPARQQTYTLNGKRPYVRTGGRFRGNESIIAGAPQSQANLSDYLERQYDPLVDLGAVDPVDRYAAVKAVRFREDLHRLALPLLEPLLAVETDKRIALEAAGSLAVLGSSSGQAFIHDTVLEEARADLRMEAVFILTELGTAFARQELLGIAENRQLGDDELRQAAVWGLGKTGLKTYGDLVPFIDDPAENVALHAIAAFGKDTPASVIGVLVDGLGSGDPRRSPAASEALRIIGSAEALDTLVRAALSGSCADWIVATIGRFPAALVRPRLEGTTLLDRIAPFLLLAEGEYWLSSETMRINISFLVKQNI